MSSAKKTDPHRGEQSKEEAALLLLEIRALFAERLNASADTNLSEIDQLIEAIRMKHDLPEMDERLLRISADRNAKLRKRQNGGGLSQAQWFALEARHHG